MLKNTRHIIAAISSLIMLAGCSGKNFTVGEKIAIKMQKGQIMRLLKVDNSEDSVFLRQTSNLLTEEDLLSEEYQTLKEGMLLTVNDPQNPGVGIAAPQVGIGKKLIVVKRYDKADTPYEAYPNAKIVYSSASTHKGREGCLSIPRRRAIVPRADTIVVEYTDEKTLEIKSETLSGYTAVIFQHEIDHLNGELYIDKMSEEMYYDTLAEEHPEYLPGLEINKTAPDFSAPDVNGNTVRLSDYRGKMVILDFWATWCIDCRREMPEFKKLYEEFNGKKIDAFDLQFISYSFDRDEQAWRHYVLDNRLDWVHVCTLQPKWKDIATTQDYKLHWIPAFIVIAPDGKVITKCITVASLRQMLLEMTGEYGK